MKYYQFQQKVYQNKLNRNFNISNVGKEIILITEEFGELCDAHLTNNKPEIIDAIGDIMIYCLGLSAIFKWNCDDISNHEIKLSNNPTSLQDYIPYLGKEIGMIAKTYKHSNKQEVESIDKLDEFKLYIGNLINYCDNLFNLIKVDGNIVIENIISNNKTRTHQGQI